mmetsp:Transcript_13487/g.37347  ORF Transcript_13487/g.37347 Transcript_13487/m.37347 type:complete len:231 (+) Transcript_13487:1243-1935(+)
MVAGALEHLLAQLTLVCLLLRLLVVLHRADRESARSPALLSPALHVCGCHQALEAGKQIRVVWVVHRQHGAVGNVAAFEREWIAGRQLADPRPAGDRLTALVHLHDGGGGRLPVGDLLRACCLAVLPGDGRLLTGVAAVGCAGAGRLLHHAGLLRSGRCALWHLVLLWRATELPLHVLQRLPGTLHAPLALEDLVTRADPTANELNADALFAGASVTVPHRQLQRRVSVR